MAQEIFISYSRQDLSKAKKIKQDIEKLANTECWMDIKGIEGGDQFEDIIISAIDNSKIVLFLLSKNSMNSEWTKKEVKYAYDTGKKVVPIRIDDSKLQGWFQFNFGGVDVIDYADKNQKDKLIENIKGWIEPCTPPIGKEEEASGTSKAKHYPPYFANIANAYIGIQTIGISIITGCFCVVLLFGMISKNWNNTLILDSLLIADFLAMIGCTCLIKKHKLIQWSFAILDSSALALFALLCNNVYVFGQEKNISFTTIPYKVLNIFGLLIHNNLTLMLFIAFIAIFTHIVCTYVIMQGRVLWNNYGRRTH